MKTPPPLPPLLVVTDGSATAGRPLTAVIGAAIDGGARAVLLREKHLSRRERSRLAEQIAVLLSPVGGVLLVASDPSVPADGIHLSASDPTPEPLSALTGRSCHMSADVARAAAEGCCYAVLSPIYRTISKPGYGPALGPAALGRHVLPVWALGGVDVDTAASCIEAGAGGVAVMGAIMRSPDPARTVAQLCAALASAQRP